MPARRIPAKKPADCEPFLRSLVLVRERVASFDAYPFSIPALRNLERLDFSPTATILVGENGSGKSTLIEAIAVAAGFNPEGGSRNFNFANRPSESSLVDAIRLVRGTRRPRTGFFLRAESFFNMATEVERLDKEPASMGRSAQSTVIVRCTSARTASRSWRWPCTASFPTDFTCWMSQKLRSRRRIA